MKAIVLIALLGMIGRPQSTPHFIAMEYKGMSNCIYKIYVTDSFVFGAKVNGYITVEPSFGTGHTVPKEKMHDPEAYVDKSMDKYDDLLSDHPTFLKGDKDNFIIRRSAIKMITNNPNKKFGMGYYPYGGRIEIETAKTPENRRGDRELILIGDQDPEKVLGLLK